MPVVVWFLVFIHAKELLGFSSFFKLSSSSVTAIQIFLNYKHSVSILSLFGFVQRSLVFVPVGIPASPLELMLC